MIAEGLAVDDGAGGWIRTVRGMAVAELEQQLEEDALARLEADEIDRIEFACGAGREWDFTVKGDA